MKVICQKIFLNNIRTLVLSSFCIVFIIGCVLPLGGTQKGAIYSENFGINSDVLDSMIVNVLTMEGIKISYSPFNPGRYAYKNEFQARILSLGQNKEDFILSFSTVGTLAPIETELILLSGSWSGEVHKLSGNMSFQEKRTATRIFKKRIITPVRSAVDSLWSK